MRIRLSSAPFITLVIMTLVLAAACNSTPTNSNGAGTPTNANNSNARPAASAATPAATTSGPLSTPTNAFKAFYEASKKKDVPAVMKTLSKDTVDFLTAEAKKENKTLEVALTESLKTSDVPTTAPETRNEKIDGDKATLEVKDDKVEGKWDTFNFARENGEWKIKLGIE
ncbi:MAG: DUF4878 domain-containing protein [Acidobacteria bacterium]|nr:DUF4878 domain-containing protein [Acidobacteriota bacterium]